MSGEDTVAVLGLGLVGGSLARDLASAGVHVMGYDQDRDALSAALEQGVIDTALDHDLAGIEAADMVVLAVPPGAASTLLAKAAPRLHHARLITDVASTKLGIASTADALGLGRVFVGAHPLAGDHRRGWSASRAGLFRDATVFLCPSPNASANALARALELWRATGASPRLIEASEHDALLAHVSHLPQLAAFALARVIARAGHPAAELGPGGRDTLRLAASDPALWADIALDNSPFLLPLLERCAAEFTALHALLEQRDRAALRDAFSEAGRWRSGT